MCEELKSSNKCSLVIVNVHFITAIFRLTLSLHYIFEGNIVLLTPLHAFITLVTGYSADCIGASVVPFSFFFLKIRNQIYNHWFPQSEKCWISVSKISRPAV